MNVDLAHVLLTNLLKNAITHNEQGGTIRIVCTENQIIIANSGTVEIQNIFSRYNGNNNKQNSVNSSGLGLSITKSIADLYQINIEYRFEEKKHIFILNF
jgi:K+-sensing histidine kinase KdpD